MYWNPRQIKKSKYEFLRKVFNLPSARTLSQYDSIGGNEPDGLLFTVLDTIQNEYKLEHEDDDWMKMVSLKFDACHICDKVKYNPHTNQLVGFTYNAFDKDVLLEDLNKLSNVEVDNSKQAMSENRAQQYLIFMINCWEKQAKPLKYVIARYAVGAGVTATLLLSELPKIMCGLYSFGIIVNNITADGASENRSAFRALANISIKEIFEMNSSIKLTTKQKTLLPLTEYDVAFRHPIQDNVIILVGGEMPHLVKKIVNAFERSGSVKSTDLQFRGEHISLKMLQQLWLCQQNETQIRSIRIIF